ncbi:MAG: gliding motility-associated C-terminal domain-containing protein [Candidatus Latescibacteria bacterium]|jgi:hypothetical protein|nr:hypothetical protein [Gemmatimonadaceae bacterium]MDP6018950.1 gliding motility-associated C-terminal domain-containing protein [Candidatus Latescibacterota bacterium]MDP7448984.1 gliding motility-associated C-terminal domain-containing protein [Candidatus Latescibacterota bacterium]HJP31233.1 gliding motility-associated C-terminal domain-containing protein [Candidatus Latescibacterota bacterium]
MGSVPAFAAVLLVVGLMWPRCGFASERLVVGTGGAPWTDVADSTAFLVVTPDSVFLPAVRPGENLASGAVRRGGGIFAVVGLDEEGVEPDSVSVPALAWMIDGDGNTAYNPDEAGMPRGTAVIIDLGGTFAIDRVRVFPRLDSQHQDLFPQAYDLEIAAPTVPLLRFFQYLNERFTALMRATPTLPNERSIIDWPGLRQVSGERVARYLRWETPDDLPWEVAELEVSAAGTSPGGEIASFPMLGTGTSVWGRVLIDGRNPEGLPIILQTRTGPDDEPLHYFVDVGPVRRQVTRAVWENIEQIRDSAGTQGPVVPNPEWSSWQTVVGGTILSPGPNRFIQFRLKLLQPGTTVSQMVFEYATRPIADKLLAEIDPREAEPGQETAFSLAMEMRAVREPFRTDSGFRFLDIATSAQIIDVDSVLVDDVPVVFTQDLTDSGFRLDLWRRVFLDGSFLSLHFRARVFADATRFDVQFTDRRYSTGEPLEEVNQFAAEGDADPFTVGAELEVRLKDSQNTSIVGELVPPTAVITPNDDGINDVLSLPFSLFKLTREAPVFVEIFELSGRPVRRGLARSASGRMIRVWDGTHPSGDLVRPGVYLFRVRVDADAGQVERTGVVGVVY